jgi:hypothetical protein
MPYAERLNLNHQKWRRASGLDTSIQAAIGQSLVAHVGGPYSAAIGQMIQFDASALTSSHGTLAFYEWDFDNDGQIDQITAEPTVQHSYATTYFGAVRLTVTDFVGNTATRFARVGVPALLPPRIYIPMIRQ